MQTIYELRFWGSENIDVSVFMIDLRMINLSSEYEYDWCWKISACSTEYEVCDSFASLTRHQASYASSAGWYFRYQSIYMQITYTHSTHEATQSEKRQIISQRTWLTSGVIFSTRPEIYNCISFSLMSIIMWSSWWQCVPSQFVNIIGILTAILVISSRDATSVGIKFNVLLTIYVGFHIFQEV